MSFCFPRAFLAALSTKSGVFVDRRDSRSGRELQFDSVSDEEFGRLKPTRDFSGGEPRGSSPEKSWGIPSPAFARTCYSSLKLNDFVGYLDTTDRVPEGTVVVDHEDIAALEVEEVGEVAVRS